jgi:hypothetical protein
LDESRTAWSLKALQPEFGFYDLASRRAAVVSAVAGLVQPHRPHS